MATPGRTEGSDLERSDLARLLESEPFRFDFFQAVRLLERIAPERRPVGRFVKPSSEAARFGARPALAFPASQIQSIQPREGEPPFVEVNFMGVDGPLGVLPYAYTELILERLRQKDTALRDFLDIFNHRIVSLFYQAWEKYRFTVAYERGELDRFSHHLLDLIGLGAEGLQKRQDTADDSLIYYSGLLGLNTRSAAALEQILSDYFDAPVSVQQFVGAWQPLEESNQCRLGEETGPSEQLGCGAVVGDEIWDQQSRVRIRLGPLTIEQYRNFLPGGDAWKELRAIARFFTRDEFDVEAQFVLRREDVPPCELAGESADAPRLGWSTWVKSAPFHRDPDETVLQVE
jgi:type VI secretion system protein ImpH